MIVTRYGLHWAPGGIPFLVQSAGSQNLIARELESPFVVNVRPRRLQCPHAIDLSNHVPSPTWLQDPLAQAFVPTPAGGGEKVRLILDPDQKLSQLLLQLERLCSPVECQMRPIWFKEAQRETPRYGLTNLGPMVFLGATQAGMKDVFRHIELSQVTARRVLIVARDRLPVFDGVEWIETGLSDVSGEPLEAIGAGALREHMQCTP
jgi:hypothetical protein